jgi:H+/gluconate symporter-like permease
MIGVLGILIALALLMYLAYRGINVLILAPLLSLLAVLAGSDTRLLATFTQVYMTSIGASWRSTSRCFSWTRSSAG